MPVLRFTVNGEPREAGAPAARPLLEVLREDFHLTGVKHGCGERRRRDCTVLIDGAPPHLPASHRCAPQQTGK